MYRNGSSVSGKAEKRGTKWILVRFDTNGAVDPGITGVSGSGALFCPVLSCCPQDSVLRFTKEIAVLRFGALRALYKLYLFPFLPPSLCPVLRISGQCPEISPHITMQFAYGQEHCPEIL